MQYIESPTIYESRSYGKSIFLAGGISGCSDWQREVVNLLRGTNLTLLNPRRKSFPKNDHSVMIEQIKWEYGHLRKSDAILFWFPYESLCPIALYELGAWSMTNKPLYVGMHPDYERRQDIEIQTQLARPELELVYSLSRLAKQIIDSHFLKSNGEKF